jgi:hypothetical protein
MLTKAKVSYSVTRAPEECQSFSFVFCLFQSMQETNVIATSKLQLAKVQYMYIWKCQNKTPCVTFIY